MRLFAFILNIGWVVYFICAAGSAANERENHLAIFGILTGVLNVWVTYSPTSTEQLAGFFKITRKRIAVVAVAIFLATCFVPPWQYTEDVNGGDGFHSRRPAGCSPIFYPPSPRVDRFGFGVKIDLGRLFLEWAFIGVLFSTVFALIKPTLKDKAEIDPNKPITLGDLAQFQREIKPYLKKPEA